MQRLHALMSPELRVELDLLLVQADKITNSMIEIACVREWFATVQQLIEFRRLLIQAIDVKGNSLLQIPYNNGEDLQIVRYEEGQFYRTHHDQNTAPWTPQGPRVLTFFMYLNQPESGVRRPDRNAAPPALSTA